MRLRPLVGTLVPAPARVVGVKEKRLQAAMAMRERIFRKARRVVDAMALAAEIDDEGDGGQAAPEGWTKVQYRVARDARKPKRESPMYLEAMTRIAEVAERVEAATARPVNQTNITQINMVAPRVYGVQEVKE